MPDYKDFSNQFILCKLEEHIPTEWGKKELGGWLLGFHPSLPVMEIQNSTSLHLGWLLGYPIDENGKILKKLVIYNQEPGDKDLAGFESWLHRLVGTFVAVLITPHASRFYLDSGGTMAAVFHPEYQIVASTPTLISDAEDDEALVKTMGIPDDNWFPFGLTPKKSVERLLPNHYLDLVTWNSCRHWPKEGTVATSQDAESTVREIIQVLTRNIEGVAREYPVYLSLTAGQDSRMLLACAKNLLDNITFFTIRTPDESGALDCAIASEIAQRFNLRHIVLEYQQATEQQQKDWLDRTGHCIGGRVYINFATLYQLDPECAILPGTIGAIGRASYRRRFDITPPLTTEKILRSLGLPQTPEIVKRANKWLQEFVDYDLFTALEILYIEGRLGCWAAPMKYGNNWNVFEVYPFCHKGIFESILSLPPDYRVKLKLRLDLLKIQWPELLEFPINNYRGIRGIRKNIRNLKKSIKRDIRELGVVKGVRKILR